MSNRTVLVVDDEAEITDLYATWLRSDYEVKTAISGEEALEELDDSVDVVLLDRRMPGLSGDAVLDEIRDRGLDTRVIMVTAVDPDFDIVDMPFDAYAVKPIDHNELLDIVSQVQQRQTYDAKMQRYFSLASKKAVLEVEKTETELDESEEYQALLEEFEELSSDLDFTMAEFDDEDFSAAFRDIERTDPS